MNDLEITRKCAEAMGLPIEYDANFTKGMLRLPTGWIAYDPLHNDEQAMALVKKFGLLVDPQQDGQNFEIDPGWEVSHVSLPDDYLSINTDLNRAICECVAKMATSP